MNDIFVKCTKCKKDKNIIHFMKDDKQLKQCENCRIYKKNNSIKNLCPCGKSKHFCEKHGGSCLCPCGKLKRFCKIHGGRDLCPCRRNKRYCKLHSDARGITINHMINGSRRTDKKQNLFDENQFIDEQFVSNLLDLYKNCIYCNCELNFDKRNSQLATIERLDNSLGHIKRNCVIACYTCNVSKVGDKYN